MATRIAVARRSPGVIESTRPDPIIACFVRFPIPASPHPVDIELSRSRGFQVRLDDGRVLNIGSGMGLRVGGCDYSRSGFVSDVPELAREALFTLIDPASAQLSTRTLIPGTRVLVTLRGNHPKSAISIKRVALALETPDPHAH